jgi:Xaa-Pro aminopeptidase
MVYQHRQAAALAAAKKRFPLKAILVSHLPDIRYLTGFTGSNGILVLTAKTAVLFTDGRYTTQARAEAVGTRVIIGALPVLDEACIWLQANRITRCGIDQAHTSLQDLDRMRRLINGKIRRKFFCYLPDIAALLRESKDRSEIAIQRRAARLGCQVYEQMLSIISPGMSEIEVAAELEYRARSLGAQGMAFDTIVASGPRSALPHGHATTARLPRKGFLTLDFGVILDGYCSDMTRTVHLGRATETERQAYDAVLAAELAGIDAVSAGVSCNDVDAAARNVLHLAKLGKWFTHSTGHGVGLEIHEGPRLARGQTQKLLQGMVITIEPGVYLPGRFGIRIEDMVEVTTSGCRILTPSPKGWTEL